MMLLTGGFGPRVVSKDFIQTSPAEALITCQVRYRALLSSSRLTVHASLRKARPSREPTTNAPVVFSTKYVFLLHDMFGDVKFLYRIMDGSSAG